MCWCIGKVFGPLPYSRHDLAVLTIMRGRDHGVPDYNTIRKNYGLDPITDWKDINPWLYDINPQVGVLSLAQDLNDDKAKTLRQIPMSS